MIAHRLRTITGVDKIFVMDAGRVSECGTHEELQKPEACTPSCTTPSSKARGGHFNY